MRGKETERDTAEQEKSDREHFAQRQDAEEPRHRDLTLSTRTVEEQEQNNIRTTIRGKEKERDNAEQAKADRERVTQKQDAAEPRHRNLTLITRPVEEPEHNNSGTIIDTTVTIQTTEGIYEARLAEDNSNNFPIQKKMKLTGYRISNPPRMMRNIPQVLYDRETAE